jgi:hypothetical protein
MPSLRFLLGNREMARKRISMFFQYLGLKSSQPGIQPLEVFAHFSSSSRALAKQLQAGANRADEDLLVEAPISIGVISTVIGLRRNDLGMSGLTIRARPVEANVPAGALAAVAPVSRDLLMHRDAGQHH